MNEWLNALIFSPFWFSFGSGLALIRLLADWIKLRWYHQNRFGKRLHLHHFLFGFPMAVASWITLLLGHGITGQILAGFAAALWFSEAKELILQKWNK